MKKSILFIILASFMISGCGNTDEPEQSAEAGEIKEPVATTAPANDQKKVELEDDWYNTVEESSKTPKVELEDAVKEEVDEEVEFTSREQDAANNLPYFFTNIRMERRNKKDYVIAEPDTAAIGDLYVADYNMSMRDLAKIASDTNSEELLQIIATIMPKTASGSSYLQYFFLACTLYERNLHGVTSIERQSDEDKFIGYDAEKHKIEVDISTGDYKYANAGMLVNEELKVQIAQKLYDKTGIMLPDVADQLEQAAADDEAEKLMQEIQSEAGTGEGVTAEEAAVKPATELDENTKLLAQIIDKQVGIGATNAAAAPFKTFTDKRGTVGSYTQGEWAYLQSIWLYAGHDVDNFVMDHTHEELRALLNSRH